MDSAIVNRFWDKVEIIPFHPCWEWTAALVGKGYGHFKAGPRVTLAHRFSYELSYGPVPTGLFVMHKCDNPPCVNPDHLRVGTNADNVRDMVLKGRAGKKLSARQISEIQEKYKSGGYTQSQLAREYGCFQTTISIYVNNKHAGAKYKCTTFQN